jgi:uncharacterized protein (DUF885 family)
MWHTRFNENHGNRPESTPSIRFGYCNYLGAKGVDIEGSFWTANEAIAAEKRGRTANEKPQTMKSVAALAALLTIAAAYSNPVLAQTAPLTATEARPLSASPSALGSTSPSASKSTSNDDRFAAIAQKYFYAGFRQSPVNATISGYHAYDEVLDDVSPATFAAGFAREHQALAAIAAIDPATLTAEVAIDRTMLEHSIQEDLLRNEAQAQWRRDPDVYTTIAAGAVYGPISRDYAPLTARMTQVIARERGIPKLFAQAKRNIGAVDASTKTAAYENASGTVDLFARTLPLAFKPVTDPKIRAAFASANAAAMSAVKSYAAWIKAHRASGTFALGAATYAKLLVYEDSVHTPLPRLLDVARTALAQTRAQYIATSKRIDPAKSPTQVYAEISRVHPAGPALLTAAQNDLVRLRAYLIAQQIVTVPPDADIRVTETPQFQRATTQAAMDAPGPLETVATRAYYYVTPPDHSWSKSETEGYLEQFSDFERPIISAHEVYPGHFLNFIVDKHLPLSLTRKLLGSGSYIEGWAHYDEQMMVDEGWGNGDPRVRFAQLQEALLRNCRFVAGIELHAAGWTQQRAQDLFERSCFQPKAVAEVEALRGTQDPLYGRYTLGKLMILKLRSDYRAKAGAAYTLQRFHDDFLAHGDPPIPLLRKLLLGGADDGKLL